MWKRNDHDELVVVRTYQRHSLLDACTFAEELRQRYDASYPLINVQFANGEVYADYEI